MTWYDFSFATYKVNTADYSGNDLTGVPGHTVLLGIDLEARPGMYVQASVNRTSAIPLNDANDQYADPYTLVQGRIGWKRALKGEKGIDIFLGVDNALNQGYSLGNDINAFGRRFYNPAAVRNYYGGLRFSF
jgi:iron complex outermembrane receptor protein